VVSVKNEIAEGEGGVVKEEGVNGSVKIEKRVLDVKMLSDVDVDDKEEKESDVKEEGATNGADTTTTTTTTSTSSSSSSSGSSSSSSSSSSTTIAEVSQKVKTVLILAPVNVLLNWRSEYDKWCALYHTATPPNCTRSHCPASNFRH
jgi:BRCT domain type II-containing protein